MTSYRYYTSENKYHLNYTHTSIIPYTVYFVNNFCVRSKKNQKLHPSFVSISVYKPQILVDIELKMIVDKKTDFYAQMIYNHYTI
jgi:hypothetical protein